MSLLGSFLLDLYRFILDKERGTESLAKEYFCFHLIEDLLRSISSERSTARDKLKEEDSHGPDIDLVIIWSILNHLWRHVLISST